MTLLLFEQQLDRTASGCIAAHQISMRDVGGQHKEGIKNLNEKTGAAPRQECWQLAGLNRYQRHAARRGEADVAGGGANPCHEGEVSV
jgi:hypothetical protein